jgi:phospholipid N-methyltransferase
MDHAIPMALFPAIAAVKRLEKNLLAELPNQRALTSLQYMCSLKGNPETFQSGWLL